MLGKVIRKTSAGGGKGFGDVVRYVARDRDDQVALRERFGAPDMGTINLDCPLDAHEDRMSAIAILDGTAAAVQARRQTGHPAYHIEFSWKEGEHPTRQQVAQAADHVMRSVGMAEHQAIWAIHQDTDNDHVHLVVNRVHPDTHRIQKVPGWDWLKLDKAMREIEGVQGWRHDNGPWIAVQRERPGQKPELDIVRMSRTERAQRGLLKDSDMRVSDKAHRAEQNIGADAFQRWVAGSPGRGIKATLANRGATWDTIHQAAAQYGCVIQPKGSGMIVTTTLDDGRVLAAKASQLGRWASKAELEKKLGPYRPPDATQTEPSLTYQRVLDGGKGQLHGPGVRGDRADKTDRRLERQAARKDLAERFKQEQAALRARRPALRKALTERHRAERRVLTAELRQMRAAAIAEHQRDGMRPQVAIAYQAWVAAARREEVQKRQAAERREIAARIPRAQVWRTWLEQQAEQGDEAAQAALRGIRYREQRKSKAYAQQDGIEGEDLDPLRKLTVAALQAEIDHKRQLVIYRGKDDQVKFTDTGPRIVMHDKADDSLEAALRIAAQKYGGKVAITGSSAFRERAARQAVRLGITVSDADLQDLVQEEQRRMEAARKPSQARRDAGVDAPPGGTGGAAGSAREGKTQPQEESTEFVDKFGSRLAQSASAQDRAAVPTERAPAPFKIKPESGPVDASERAAVRSGCSGRYGFYDGASKETLQAIVDAASRGDIATAAQLARRECRAHGLSGGMRHFDRRLDLMALDMRPLVGREAADQIAQGIRRAWGEGRGLLDAERHAPQKRERDGPARG
jgi:hypothetical protein